MSKQIEEKCKWAWMMDWCKHSSRQYAPASDWAWKYAEEAWDARQEYLRVIKAEHSCWYCQLGIGSGRISLQDVPEPLNWKDTLCERHLKSITPVHQDGEGVVCELCKKEYKYYPWNSLAGRQDKRCYCRKCVSGFPARHLDDDRLVEGEPDELDHLTNIEKSFGVRDY
jgi:hypothetical protein